MRILFSLAFAASLFAAGPEEVPLARHILTNDGLIVLARSGVGDSLLTDLIRHKRTQFDTSADALALLSRHGMSENVIRAVVEKQEQVQLRKPRVQLSPVTATAAPMEVENGEVILLPSPNTGRRGRSEPDRWYKVWLR